MFYSQNNDQDEVQKLEQKNYFLEKQLEEMKNRLARLETSNVEVRAPASQATPVKVGYEGHLQHLFQKNMQLEDKLGQVNKMIAEMEELERKKKGAAQPLPTPPPYMNNTNNWMPPNGMYFGNSPQPQGQMPFPGPHQGGMMFPGPHLQGNMPFQGPMGMQYPMNQMPVPPQPPTPRGPPSSFENPKQNFQPQKGNQNQPNKGGPGPNKQKGQRNTNFNPQGQDSKNVKPSQNKNTNSNPQGQDSKNAKPSQNKDEKKKNDQKEDRPLFLNINKSRSRSQPRSKSQCRMDTPDDENKSGKQTEKADKEKQVRFETKGKNKGSENVQKKEVQKKEAQKKETQKKELQNKKQNPGGTVHDRRTNFKASCSVHPHTQRPRPSEGDQSLDSDDSSDSSSTAEEETNTVVMPPSILKQPGKKETNNVPDLVKVGERKEETTPEEGKKKKKPKKKKKKAADTPTTEPEKVKDGKQKGGKVEAKPAEEVPLSRTNLGENNILMKFIGTSIPNLIDSVALDINLNTKVSGVVVMSDPNGGQPVLETPKTLFDIVTFKMKYPYAKSILL